MDLNIRLIDAVRQCPLLYKSNASLAERQCVWRQISKDMMMQEAILKSRWHFLREHFQRNAASGNGSASSVQFPYKREMEFLLPYIRQPKNDATQREEEYLPANIIKPEFVITEKDLENDSGNEEYVFLEVETLGSEEENNVIQSSNDCEQQQAEESNENTHNDETLELEFEKETTECDKSSESLENEKSATFETEPTSDNAITKNEEVIKKEINALEDASKNTESKETVSNTSRNSNAQHTADRCEDAIFGELVTAMLKRMPAEKKREFKLHIMNLLLTE